MIFFRKKQELAYKPIRKDPNMVRELARVKAEGLRLEWRALPPEVLEDEEAVQIIKDLNERLAEAEELRGEMEASDIELANMIDQGVAEGVIEVDRKIAEDADDQLETVEDFERAFQEIEGRYAAEDEEEAQNEAKKHR